MEEALPLALMEAMWEEISEEGGWTWTKASKTRSSWTKLEAKRDG